MGSTHHVPAQRATVRLSCGSRRKPAVKTAYSPASPIAAKVRANSDGK